MSIASAHRPTQWTLASPDLNVLLTGRFVDDGEIAQKTEHDRRRFQLAQGGLYIVSRDSEPHELASVSPLAVPLAGPHLVGKRMQPLTCMH